MPRTAFVPAPEPPQDQPRQIIAHNEPQPPLRGRITTSLFCLGLSIVTVVFYWLPGFRAFYRK